MRVFRAIAATVVACLLVAVGAWAQVAGALIVRVLDVDGAPLPGAVVRLTNDRGLVGEEASTTDREGLVHFPVLRVGRGYAVEVSAPGHATRREVDVAVTSGGESRLTIQLTAEQVEWVRVSPERPLVDLEDVTSSTTFSDEFVADLPVVGRFYQTVVTLAPGVTDPDNDGNPIVHGSRSRDFQANVSGVSNVDPFSGQSAALVNPNSIEELEVITGGASVEFGRAQGGFANVVQKQGTNEFEGVAEFLYQDGSLDLAGLDGNIGVLGISSVEAAVPDFESIQPSLSFSGPIVRDRVWFRLNHDLIDRQIGVNTLDGLAVTPEKRWLHSDQLTWQATPRNKLQLQFSLDDSDNGNVGVSSLISPASSFEFQRRVETAQLNWTAAYSTRVLIDSVVARTTIENAIGPSDPDQVNDCLPFDGFLASTRCTNTVTGQISGPTPLIRDTQSERLTVRSQATVHAGRFAGGSHQFKLGFNIENERYFQTDDVRPELRYFEFPVMIPNPFGMGTFRRTVRAVDAEVSVPAIAARGATGNGYGFYFEDRYRPLSNLTLTFGARIDRDESYADGQLPFDPVAELSDYLVSLDDCLTVAAQAGGVSNLSLCQRRARNATFTSFPDIDIYLDGLEDVLGIDDAQTLVGGFVAQQDFFASRRRTGTINIANTTLSPLLSLKWDPFRTGRTAFSASYRRYYDKIFLNVPLLESLPPRTNVTFEVIGNSSEGPFFVRSGREPLDGIEAAPTILTVDRNLKTPYQDELVLAFEREVATETVFRVEYVNRRYRDQFQDVDINRAPGDFGRCRLADFDRPETIVESTGEAYVDEFTGEIVADTTPGPGDGIIDDCSGQVVGGGSTGALGREVRVERPDGLPDLYVQNPAFGSVLFLSNDNWADYDAVVLTLTRRQFRNWELQGSYTWSRAEGNGEDFQQEFGNDQSLTGAEFGYQSTDQRHFVRLLATATLPWAMRVGGTVRWQSGLPYSVLGDQLSFADVPLPLGGFGGNVAQIRTIYETGSRNDQRNPAYWLFDAKLTKELRAGRGVNLQLSAEVFNLFNRDFYRVYNDVLQQGRVFNGEPEATRDYGRRWQVGIRVAF